MISFEPKETFSEKEARITSEALSTAIDEALVEIKTFKEELLELGYEVAEDQHIQLNDTTITRFNGVMAYSSALEYPYGWICAENTEYSISSQEEFVQIGASMLSLMSEYIRSVNTVKVNVRNATTIEEVEALKEAYLNSDGKS